MELSNIFNGMFGKLKNGLCRMTFDGATAIKTSTGAYKTYDVNKNSLVNCDGLTLPMGEEFFFIIPTNKVDKGDIILNQGKPACVISVNNTDNVIKVLDYETSAVMEILPEKHMFMGNTYFYGKIVSLFGGELKLGGKNKMMSYMLMSQLMGGNGASFGGNNNNAMQTMMMMSMMGGNGGFMQMFENMFDGGSDKCECEDCKCGKED